MLYLKNLKLNLQNQTGKPSAIFPFSLLDLLTQRVSESHCFRDIRLSFFQGGRCLIFTLFEGFWVAFLPFYFFFLTSYLITELIIFLLIAIFFCFEIAHYYFFFFLWHFEGIFESYRLFSHEESFIRG